MESAYVDDFFSGVADGRSGTAVASSAAVEAAEEAGAQPTDDEELPGGGSGRKFLWELPESWKRDRIQLSFRLFNHQMYIQRNCCEFF